MAAYIFASWLISNHIFLTNTPTDSLEKFAYMDCPAAAIITVMWLHRPAIWIGLLAVSLDTSLVFNVLHHFEAPIFVGARATFIALEPLYVLQLFAVTGPFFTRLMGHKPRKTASFRAKKVRKRSELMLIWDRDAA